MPYNLPQHPTAENVTQFQKTLDLSISIFWLPVHLTLIMIQNAVPESILCPFHKAKEVYIACVPTWEISVVSHIRVTKFNIQNFIQFEKQGTNNFFNGFCIITSMFYALPSHFNATRVSQ